MKMKKTRIAEIIREELGSYLHELLEAPPTVGADEENDDKEPDQSAKDVAPKRGAKKGPEAPDGDQPDLDKATNKSKPPSDEDGTDEEVPVDDDPADDKLDKDVVEPSDDEEKKGGDITDEIVGKTIQSMTLEPESKMMPGAAEITIQFEEIPHPLKILIGKSGMIKYHFKGTLHNEL